MRPESHRAFGAHIFLTTIKCKLKNCLCLRDSAMQTVYYIFVLLLVSASCRRERYFLSTDRNKKL